MMLCKILTKLNVKHENHWFYGKIRFLKNLKVFENVKSIFIWTKIILLPSIQLRILNIF